MDQFDLMMQLPELDFAPMPPTYPLNYTPTPHFPQNLQNHTTMEAMREMIYRMAMMQPVHIEPESVKPPKRRNVRISKDPQSVAARQRREKISERMRILQRMVPGGTKMDTASMLDEAIHYVKFLKKQVQRLEKAGVSRPIDGGFGLGFGFGSGSGSGSGSGFCLVDGGVYMNA